MSQQGKRKTTFAGLLYISGVAWVICPRVQFLVCVSMASCSVNSGRICLQKLPNNCDSNTMLYLYPHNFIFIFPYPHLYLSLSSSLSSLSSEFQLLPLCFPIATHVPFFFLTCQCHEVQLDLKKILYNGHTCKQKINNHILNSSSGGLVNR